MLLYIRDIKCSQATFVYWYDNEWEKQR